MKKYVASVITILGILLSHSMQGTASGSVVVDRVVAVVNDEIITLSDLQREEAKNRAEKTGGAKIDEKLLLEDMINRKLEMAAAKRAGLDVSEKELDDAVADIMKRNSMDVKQFQAALAKEGLTLEQYRAELKEQITLSRVFSKYVRQGLAVDEAEVRAYYERNIKNYALPEEIRVRQILLKVPDGATPADVDAIRQKAQAVFERAKRGEDFVKLVHEFSESDTAANDGDLGFMQRDYAIPEIEQAARSLKRGEIAGPIRCSSGFQIIRLEDVRTRTKPFEQVKDEITKLLYQQKMENTYRAWLQTLRNESHIENRL